MKAESDGTNLLRGVFALERLPDFTYAGTSDRLQPDFPSRQLKNVRIIVETQNGVSSYDAMVWARKLHLPNQFAVYFRTAQKIHNLEMDGLIIRIEGVNLGGIA